MLMFDYQIVAKEYSCSSHTGCSKAGAYSFCNATGLEYTHYCKSSTDTETMGRCVVWSLRDFKLHAYWRTRQC